jgi:hypothetical protein
MQMITCLPHIRLRQGLSFLFHGAKSGLWAYGEPPPPSAITNDKRRGKNMGVQPGIGNGGSGGEKVLVEVSG